MSGGGGKINNDNSQWGPPQAVGMMGPNGQMNAPQMNMPMGAPNMMPGYQSWGTSPQQQGYGYGGSNAPGSYQGWGAPPGLQGPPPQWNNYAPAQQTQYGSYGKHNIHRYSCIWLPIFDVVCKIHSQPMFQCLHQVRTLNLAVQPIGTHGICSKMLLALEAQVCLIELSSYGFLFGNDFLEFLHFANDEFLLFIH